MPELRLYNTLTRKTEPFQPQIPGKVRLYVCGPTVYDIAHAGNARPAVVFDVLARHLRASGYEVTYVRNITDVDDKILDRAKQLGEEPLALSARMAPIYQEDMRALGCQNPSVEPKVSEHIGEIIELIERLIANGAAYVVTLPSGAKDVYFSVRSFEGYGKLSRRNLDELEVGARVEPGEGKRDPLDFALWKGTTPDGWGWDSPWGKGRPGWHIECSAMSIKYLGLDFDIHGGGMDLIFPHHENEIAQAEAAYPGQRFCRIFMHNGFINVDKEKMSKSLGNFVKPRDVYENNDPEALRYLYLTVHYRGPLNFDIEKREDGRIVFPGVDEAERRVDYLYATLARLDAIAKPGEVDPNVKELAQYRDVLLNGRKRVAEALDDDLNTPVALAHIAEMAKAANELCDLAQKRRKDARFAEAAAILAHHGREALRSSLDVLGLLQTPAEVYAERTKARRLKNRGITAEFVEAKIAERAAARAAKDFAKADAIRKELEELGIDVADTAEGTKWSVRVT